MSQNDDLRWHHDSISTPLLRSAGSDALLDLHLAAIEYALATPITIRDRDDIKSQKHWSEQFEPFEHQVRNLITFCRRAPVALIADDVGLGKTISAGLVLSELMTRKKVKRALIVAPKLLLPQWCEELQSKFGIEARHASGGELDYLIRSTIPVVVTTYETARGRFEDLSKAFFDMIILDEAHKLRNLHGANKAPRVAEAVQASFRKTDFKYVLMLTATPIQNRLWDIYSLVDLLATARGHKNPLGTPGEFSSYYVQDSAATARELHPGRREEFRRRIAEYMVRTSRRDSNLIFPERRVRTLGCPAGAAETRLSALVAQTLPSLNALAQSSIAQALMSSPAALVAQLQNMAANGTVPATLPNQAAALAAEAGPGCKMARLRALLKELAKERPTDWRAVLFTRRRETQELIGRTLASEGVRVGYIRGGQAQLNQRAIRALWADPPEVNLLVSTDAGAEGVNLQAANVVINYDLPWNPMVVEQRIGRVQRLMSKYKHIIVVNLVVADSVEEKVVARLIAKLQAISETIGDVEGILETSSVGEEGMEDTIQDLVVKALMGQDVAAATEKIRQSIERAKAVYEEERAEVEKNLGGLDAMHTAGPKMPDLEEVTPRLKVEDFVQGALLAGGASVSPMPDGRWLVKAEGRSPFILTFNENDPDLIDDGLTGFYGKRAELYSEGRPPFERLVGEWSKRDGARLADWTDADGSTSLLIAEDWAQRFGDDVVVEDWKPKSRRPRLVGQLVVRTSGSVSIDRYEKLVALDVGSADVRAALAGSAEPPRWVRGDVGLREQIDGLLGAVREAVSRDHDMAAFCAFYEARRDEEARKSADQREADALRKRFQPALAAEVVAASGHAYEEVSGLASMRIAGGGPYAVPLVIRTGTMQVIQEPEQGQCALTGRTVPVICLSASAVSGRRALQHMLVASERSSRLGLPDETRVCQVSGKRLLSDEVAASDVSGRVVDTGLLTKSIVSGRRGLEDEIARCEFTGKPILKSEGLISQVSGRLYRQDQDAMSAVSSVRGHQSEFVRCQESGSWILESESGKSSASGKVVRKDLLVPSSLSGGLALEAEIVTCAFTGARLLPQEAGESKVSGRWYRLDEGLRSAVSGTLGHKSEFERCEQTGVPVLAKELARSVVSGKSVRRDLLVASAVSGQKALADEMGTCEFTGGRVLPSEIATSEVSGRRYRSDEEAASAKSSVRGHKTEFERCDATKELVLPSEIGTSSVSGRRVRQDLLVASEKNPARVGLASETVTCAISGKRLLSDETEKSAVSGKVADSALIAHSDKSRAPALPDELLRCEESGQMLLPSETGECQVTGMRVDTALLGVSDYSKKTVRRSLLHVCPETHRRGLEEEMGRCAASGEIVDKRQLVECAATGKLVRRSLTTTSAMSGRVLLRDHAITAQSGRVGHPDEVVNCAWTGWTMLADETRRCRCTGVDLGKAQVDQSGISLAHADLLRNLESLVPVDGQVSVEAKRLLEADGHKATRIWARKSATSAAIAVVGECRSLFGLRKKFAVCFLDAHAAKLLGRTALVDVRDGNWS
jgi:superfamily II DNA or RNA helicase